MDLGSSKYAGAVRIALRTQSSMKTAMRIFGWGEDPRVPSPGSVLMIFESGFAESRTELAVLVSGSDMELLKPLVDRAVQEWDDNKDWLDAPVSWDPASGAPRPAWSTERKSA